MELNTFILNRAGRRGGFSLIELLAVMLIISTITVLSVPALTSLSRSGRINHAVGKTSGLLEQARLYAIANNTYVYLGFKLPSGSRKAVQVVQIASKDGTDVFSAIPGSSGKLLDLSSAAGREAAVILGKVETLEQFEFRDPDYQYPVSGVIKSSGERVQNSNVIAIESSSDVYDRVMWFTPAGEAKIGEAFVERIEFGVQSTAGSERNFAIFQVAGLTGQARVYRP